MPAKRFFKRRASGFLSITLISGGRIRVGCDPRLFWGAASIVSGGDAMSDGAIGALSWAAIARALAMDPRLMLCDEPTASLDPELIHQVLAVLRQLAVAGMTMVIVTHELGFAAKFADRIVFMDLGRIVEQGPPAELLEHPKTDRLKLFLSRLRARPGSTHNRRRTQEGAE